MSEADLYPVVKRWLKRQEGVWHTRVQAGIRRWGMIDVIGIQDVGGDLSGRSEVVAVEVKDSMSRFGLSAGQAASYGIYADRCYLAVGGAALGRDHVDIASRLGIGLLEVAVGSRTAVKLVLSAPRVEPVERLRLEMLATIGIAECQMCSSLGEISGPDVVTPVRGDGRSMRQAVAKGRGYVYWLESALERIGRVSGQPGDEYVHRRRYVCADCVRGLFWDLGSDEGRP